LALMRLDDANGRPIAILVNFTAHPTMISAATLRFSADYAGAMKAEVEKATGARVSNSYSSSDTATATTSTFRRSRPWPRADTARTIRSRRRRSEPASKS
jgi:hypothetical protein